MRQNMISSHLKITCSFHMWKGHCCYGHMLNCTFHKKVLKWNGLVTFGVYIIKLEHYIYNHLEIQMFHIFQQEKGLILYLCIAMWYPLHTLCLQYRYFMAAVHVCIQYCTHGLHGQGWTCQTTSRCYRVSLQESAGRKWCEHDEIRNAAGKMLTGIWPGTW